MTTTENFDAVAYAEHLADVAAGRDLAARHVPDCPAWCTLAEFDHLRDGVAFEIDGVAYYELDHAAAGVDGASVRVSEFFGTDGSKAGDVSFIFVSRQVESLSADEARTLGARLIEAAEQLDLIAGS